MRRANAEYTPALGRICCRARLSEGTPKRTMSRSRFLRSQQRSGEMRALPPGRSVRASTKDSTAASHPEGRASASPCEEFLAKNASGEKTIVTGSGQATESSRRILLR